ncbi:MAG: hypothetical protein KDA17_06030, partial [Candidatus Saccharibacteria bacterium]|nr:hypothetical protein [Candidatus Saccharibacteria bacterium]
MSIENTPRFEVEDIPREECGVFAVARIDGKSDEQRDIPLSIQAYQGLLGLQHRGEDGAGISVYDPALAMFVTQKDRGLITDVFAGGRYLSGFPIGTIALAHTRYGTGKKSGDAAEKAHPLGGKDSLFMIAMNGHIKELENRKGMTDTEYLVDTIDKRRMMVGETFRDSLLATLRNISGGYSIVASDGKSLYAARDPWGFRPLFHQRTDKYHYFISEDSALGPLRDADVSKAQEVDPGTLWTVPLDGSDSRIESIYPIDEMPAPAMCAMEFAYFARPDTNLRGRSVQEIRMNIGRMLARIEEPDFTADVVVGIPDSGSDTAIGYSDSTGIRYVRAITKNPYVGRTFILANQELRASTAELKLNVTSALVRGKDVVVVDDSVVRGTTGRVYVRKLRDAGARSVHLRIGFPPHMNPCIYGIDTGNPTESLARRKNLDIDQMAKNFGVDSLRFITEDGLREAIEWTSPSVAGATERQLGGICMACVNGDYPTDHKVFSP